MRILYIQRSRYEFPLDWIRLWPWRQRPVFGQDGFFLASLLHRFPDTVERSLSEVLADRESVDREFDWVILNYKADPQGKGLKEEHLAWLDGLKRAKRALLVNYDSASKLPPDATLDRFERVFKRELLADLGRYELSPRQLEKLRTTMLCCPLVRVHRGNLRKMDPARAGFAEPSTAEEFDVGFTGSNSGVSREVLLRHLGRAGVGFVGGLYRKGGQPLDWDGPARAMQSRKAYCREVRRTRVNLALDGIGEFTYRHLELWCLSAFMLAPASLGGLRLPCGVRPREGEHFAAFDSPDDLVDKCRHYARDDAARRRIAAAGRRLFLEVYNFQRHGEEIAEALGAAATAPLSQD